MRAGGTRGHLGAIACRSTLALLACAAIAGCAPRASRPNLVLLLVDDLGSMDAGCYGSRFHETPHIDRLAQTGVRFSQAYAAAPVCSPTRAAILTGRHPARLGLTDWIPGRADTPRQSLRAPAIPAALPPEETTLAEVLKRAGYATALIGKWHLGGGARGPARAGFDVAVGVDGEGFTGHFPPYGIPDLRDGPPDQYLADRLTEEAIAYLERQGDRPFFLVLSHYAVHDPPVAPPELVSHFRSKLAQLPPLTRAVFALEQNPDEPAERRLGSAERRALLGTPEYAPFRYALPNRMVMVRQVQNDPVYAAMVAGVDTAIGRLLAAIDALGLSERTLVVLSSDNGGRASYQAHGTSQWPLRGGKGWLYEGGLRVPLLFRGPGVARAGGVSDALVTSADLFPTLLELAGLPPEPRLHRDGLSLAPVLRGQPGAVRDTLFWHWPHYSNHGQQSPGGAIRVGDYKLIEYFERGSAELFDLARDPGEQNDLAASLPGRAAELRARLAAWRAEVGAALPRPKAAEPP